VAYCTRNDIESLYGAQHLETLVAADVDMDAAVARACEAASAMIDGYIGRRYPVPLTAVPSVVRDYAVDIACWKVAPSHARLTDEIEKRAKAAIRYFEDVGSGKANIAALEAAVGGVGGEVASISDDGAAFSSNRRRFGGEGGLP
jgi:phage gp36-like protein